MEVVLPKSEGFVMTQQFDMLEDSDLIVRSPRGKEKTKADEDK